MAGIIWAVPPAEETATRVYNVEIPSVFKIDAPQQQTLSYTPDTQRSGSGENVVFDPSIWRFMQNHAQGATATFNISPFILTVGDKTFTRDADIEIVSFDSHGGQNNWHIPNGTVPAGGEGSSGENSGEAGGEEAKTTAILRSAAPGGVKVSLQVTFVNQDDSTLAAGTYTTNLSTTLTAN